MDGLFPEIGFLIVGVLLVLWGGYGGYSDYVFYKKNDWNWDEINPEVHVGGWEGGGGPSLRGPGRLLVSALFVLVGVVLIIIFAFQN